MNMHNGSPQPVNPSAVFQAPKHEDSFKVDAVRNNIAFRWGGWGVCVPAYYIKGIPK